MPSEFIQASAHLLSMTQLSENTLPLYMLTEC